MDHGQLSTAQDGYAHYRRLAARTLWLAACLVSAGLAWAVPMAAQDSAASSQCANGTVVPEPEDRPGLVADCEVLLALRDRFAGDADLPWSVATPIAGWEGIWIEDARVTWLVLSDNALTGPIPPELGQLTNLKGLTLSGNELSGPIPSELGQLTNLESLGLGANALTGPIPRELGQLINLQWLELGYNALTGLIPSEVGQLANLEGLGLGSNALAGPTPPELGQLTNLEYLTLSDNALTGPIPPELGQLTNLEYLTLSDNALTGPIPPELGQLANLLGLWLSFNELSGPIAPELGQLANLKVLGLDSNALTGPIPPELGQLTNLQDLRLGNNQLTGCVPETLVGWVDDLPTCGTAIEVEATALGSLPATSGLDPNFPNPFNAGTQIAYRLGTSGPARLEIYNTLGQSVRALVDEVQAAGAHRVHWDARDGGGQAVGAGVYLIRLRYPGGSQTRRMLYLE